MHLRRRQLRAGEAVLVGPSGALRQSIGYWIGQTLTETTSNGGGRESALAGGVGGSGSGRWSSRPQSVLLAGAQLPEELLAFGEEALLLLAVGRRRGGVGCRRSRLHSPWMRVGQLGLRVRYLQVVCLWVGGLIL